MVRVVLKLAALVLLSFGLAGAAAWARPPHLEDLAALRDLGGYRAGLALSPDGANVATFEREMRLATNDYRYRLLVLPLATSAAPRYVGDGGGVILRSTNGRLSGAADDRVALWSPSGTWLAYLVERDDRVELWRARADGERQERLAAPAGNVTRFAWLSEDALVFEKSTARAALDQIASVQARDGFHIDERFEPYYSLRPHPDLNAGRTVSVVRISTRRIDAATQLEAEGLNNQGMTGAPPRATAFDTSAGVHAWIGPLNPDDDAYSPALGLFVSDDASTSNRCTQPQCSGRMTDLWIAGEEIVFQRMEGHAESDTALYAWNASTNVIRLLRRADDVLLDCSRSGRALVCFHEDPVQPRRIVAVDLDTGVLRTLYDPNAPWRHLDLTRVERLDVNDIYGNEGFAHLVWPTEYEPGQRYPLVIVQYRSRGFLRGGTGGEYPIHILAAHGYFVLSVDRPEPRSLNAQFSAQEVQRRTELDGSENRMKQTAIETLLDQLDERGLIDTTRVGITGMSDGAETVYWGLINSSVFAAAVTSNPPTDPLAWTLGSEAFRRGLLAEGATGPWPDAPEPWTSWWRANTIVLHAEAIHAPLLMNFSDGEALMGFPLVTRLGELGRPLDTYIYPGEYHVKWQPLHILAGQRRTLDWLDFWLRGVERDDPNEQGRLARWRAMRDAHTSARH